MIEIVLMLIAVFSKLTRVRAVKPIHVSNSRGNCLFKFGVIADVQYMDAPDGTNFLGNKIRRYRQSLEILNTAVNDWNELDKPLACSILLGDTLDGQSAAANIQHSCLDDVLTVVSKSKAPFYYCFGNHDYYAFDRNMLLQRLIPKAFTDSSRIPPTTVGGLCSPDKLYYDFSPYPGFRFILLDCYDVSLIGASSLQAKRIADALLKLHNPNDLTRAGHWFDNLPKNKYRWVPYNGGIGSTQLQWLKNILRISVERSERVVIFCHQPIYAPNTPSSLVWNSEELLNVIRTSGNVWMWVAGHDHDGQYSIDETGIHHIVPPAPLECEEGSVAYGHVNVYPDELELCWKGKTPRKPVMPWPQKLPYYRT